MESSIVRGFPMSNYVHPYRAIDRRSLQTSD